MKTAAPILTAIAGARRRSGCRHFRELTGAGVVAHVEMTEPSPRAGRQGANAQAGVAAAASEAAGFAAWLHADMYDIGSARAYYRMAVGRARQAGHDLLAGYMLGSLAAFETDGGDPELGLTLITVARQQIGATAFIRPHEN